MSGSQCKKPYNVQGKTSLAVTSDVDEADAFHQDPFYCWGDQDLVPDTYPSWQPEELASCFQLSRCTGRGANWKRGGEVGGKAVRTKPLSKGRCHCLDRLCWEPKTHEDGGVSWGWNMTLKGTTSAWWRS